MVYRETYNTSQHNSGRSFVEQSLGVLITNKRHSIHSLKTRSALKSNFPLKRHFLRLLVSKYIHPFEFSKWVLLSYSTRQVTSFCLVTRLLIQDQGILVYSRYGKDFLFPTAEKPEIIPTQFPIQWAPPGLKWLGCESNHLPLSCTEVQYGWNSISILPYASMMWYQIKNMDIFTFN